MQGGDKLCVTCNENVWIARIIHVTAFRICIACSSTVTNTHSHTRPTSNTVRPILTSLQDATTTSPPASTPPILSYPPPLSLHHKMSSRTPRCLLTVSCYGDEVHMCKNNREAVMILLLKADYQQMCYARESNSHRGVWFSATLTFNPFMPNGVIYDHGIQWLIIINLVVVEWLFFISSFYDKYVPVLQFSRTFSCLQAFAVEGGVCQPQSAMRVLSHFSTCLNRFLIASRWK